MSLYSTAHLYLDSKSPTKAAKVNGYNLLRMAAKYGSQEALDELVEKARIGFLNKWSRLLPAELKDKIIKVLADKGIDVASIIANAEQVHAKALSKAHVASRRRARKKARRRAVARAKMASARKGLKVTPMRPVHGHYANGNKIYSGSYAPIDSQARRGISY